jgi:WD40 repeat protein
MDKTGNFKHLQKVMDLGGHTKRIYHIASTCDEKYVATLSEDRTIKLWNIDV